MTRFSRAVNSMGTFLKSTPVVEDFTHIIQSAGEARTAARQSFQKQYAASSFMAEMNWMGARGLEQMGMKTSLRSPGNIGAAAGVAAGAVVGWHNSRDVDSGAGRVGLTALTASGFGVAGRGIGGAYRNFRYAQPESYHSILREGASAFKRGWRS